MRSRDSLRLQTKTFHKQLRPCMSEKLPEVSAKTRRYLLVKKLSVLLQNLYGHTSTGPASHVISIVFRWATSGTNTIKHIMIMTTLRPKLFRVISSIYSIPTSLIERRPLHIGSSENMEESVVNHSLPQVRRIHASFGLLRGRLTKTWLSGLWTRNGIIVRNARGGLEAALTRYSQF